MNNNPKRAEENKFTFYFSSPSPLLFTRGFHYVNKKVRSTKRNKMTSHHINFSLYSTVTRHVISLSKFGSRKII